MTPGEGAAARFELARAADDLTAAHLLLEAGAAEALANRIYYAAFHAARAVLVAHGLYAKTHSGQITLFEREIGPEPILARSFSLRTQADYAIEPFGPSLIELRRDLVSVEAFVERCRSLVAAEDPVDPDPPPDL